MKEILREIGLITRCFESIANIEFKDYKLGKNQYIYLVRIAENPGIILEQLSDLIKVDRSTASRVVKNLVENGFVEKTDAQGTGKKVKLQISNKGKLAYIMLKNDEDYSNQVALNGFSQEEMELLLYYLMRIRNNVEPDWKIVRKGQERPYEKVKWSKFKEAVIEDVEIIELSDEYIKDFREISYNWLEKHDLLEPEDIRVLSNPKCEILEKGGKVLLAKMNDEIMGTVSLIKHDHGTYELAKLGVKESGQNKGIGKHLILMALLKAYELDAEKVVLYTTMRLEAAFKLYMSFGFKVIDNDCEKYNEAEIKMELCFK